MRTKIKIAIASAFIFLLLGSFASIAIYYSGVAATERMEIASLNGQVAGLKSQVLSLNNQMANLSSQIVNLTLANLMTALGITEVPFNSPHNMASQKYNHLFIEGSVNNTGKGTAFNAGLHVVAYDSAGGLYVNMTVPLTNGEIYATDNSVALYGNIAVTLGNLYPGQTANVNLAIYHQGTVCNWTITPVWTNIS